MIETGSLTEALGIANARMVTFVGAGGKTSAIALAASELVAADRTVVLTTTTLVGPRMRESASSERVLDAERADALSQPLPVGGVFLHRGARDDGKYEGLTPVSLDTLARAATADCILVEGDGARGLPIKMPDDHEPVIPNRSDVVVPVVGLDALGRTVREGEVHRPELFARLGSPALVTPATIAAVIVSAAGGMKRVPPSAAVRPLLNKAALVAAGPAHDAARAILDVAGGRIDRVVVGDVQNGSFRVLGSVADRG